MIRKMQNIDINRVADIWLKTNLKAHYFIPEQYWTSNYELVKEMLLQAEVYVYEDNKMIQGFVGLSNEYIEGIFVCDEMQSCGIGIYNVVAAEIKIGFFGESFIWSLKIK